MTLAPQAPRFRDDEWQLRCRTCGDWWPLTLDFYDPRHGTARCKACWREYHRRYERGRREDPDVVIGIRAAQRAKYRATRERRLEATRRWKAANRERIAAYQREWRARQKALRYSHGVSAGDLAGHETALDNGGVKPAEYRGPTMSLPDSSGAAA